MKRGFTIVEVSILFVIFLIVALLVIPLSLDDTAQANNIYRWKSVQSDFDNIFRSIDSQTEENNSDLRQDITAILDNETKAVIEPYKIRYLNGRKAGAKDIFEHYQLTQTNSVIAVKYFNEKDDSGSVGKIMYDVNGISGPNVWGKDVFGFDIYEYSFEPFCKNESLGFQKRNCSKQESGVCCSNYYLIGGNFDY